MSCAPDIGAEIAGHSFAGEPVVLDLVLIGYWWDEVAAGRKRTEYRKMTPRWKRLIWDRRRRIVAVRLRRGYTRRSITLPVTYTDIGRCPYAGWTGEYYRLHLGKHEVRDERNVWA